MTRRELSIEGLSVRYYDAGEGPSLLLLHGAGATARLWHRQLGPLSRLFRVIAPDLPGFGGSERWPDITSVHGYAGFLSRFMDALGMARASLVGSSMGGWASCWFALDFPDRLDRLVLISPAGLHMPGHPPMPISGVVKELHRAYAAVSGADDAARRGVSEGGAEGFDMLPGVRPNDELLRGVETLTALDAAGGFVPDLGDRLSGVAAPTLVIWGTDDPVIPASHGAEFVRLIPRSRLVTLDGAGHLPYVERPDEVCRLIAGYVGG